MNGATIITVPHMLQNPFADLKKTVLSKLPSIQKVFEDIIPAAVLISAIYAVFSGIPDLSFFQDLLTKFFSGSKMRSGISSPCGLRSTPLKTGIDGVHWILHLSNRCRNLRSLYSDDNVWISKKQATATGSSPLGVPRQGGL